MPEETIIVMNPMANRWKTLTLMAPLLFACTRAGLTGNPAATGTAGSARTGGPRVAIEKFTLANGLEVLLHQDASLPTVHVNLWYHVGSSAELPGRTGLAHFFEHAMFQGSKHSGGEFLPLIEKAGANLRAGGVNGTTDPDRTNYFETVPANALEYALWIESDRMGFLPDALDQNALDQHRTVIEAELSQMDSRPYAAQKYVIAKNLYPEGHPYGHTVTGSIDDLKAASLEEITAFFRRYYTPNNASLAIAGNFDPAVARELIKKYFGPLAPGPGIARIRHDIPHLSSNKAATVRERGIAPKLTLVWHAPGYFGPDEAPLEIAGRILGQGVQARLEQRLIREEKLATRLAAYHQTGEVSGQFLVEVIAQNEAALERIREIVLSELSALGSTGPSEAELAQQKTAIEYEFLTQLERTGGFGGRADRANRYNTYLGSPDMFDTDLQRYLTATRTDIMQSVRDWLVNRHHLEIRFLPEPSGPPDVAEIDRSVAPSQAGKLAWSVPELKTATLTNGLRLVVAERPGQGKVETALILHRLDTQESETNAGTSWLTAVMLAEGTSRRNARKLREELTELGADLVTEGSKYGSAVSMTVLKRNFDPALAILSDVIMNPQFPAAETDAAKSLRVEQIRQELSNAGALVNDLFPRILFAGKHPGALADRGTAGSIPTITRDHLQQNHRSWFAPDNATLMVAGDITLAEAETLASRHLGNWQAKKVALPPAPAAPRPDSTYIFMIDAPGASQALIRIGSNAPQRHEVDHIATLAGTALLGGIPGSRFNRNIRDTNGAPAGATAGMTVNGVVGYWLASLTVPADQVPAGLQLMKREIDGIGMENAVTAEELGELKNHLTRNYLQGFETLNQVIRQAAPLITSGTGLSYLNSFVPAVLELTPEQVATAARKYLNFSQAVVLIAGDLSKIEKQVIGMGLGEVIVLTPDGRLVRKATASSQGPGAPADPAGTATDAP